MEPGGKFDKAKPFIKGAATLAGKYTLKGIAKGGEVLGRGGVKTLHALVTNKKAQEMITFGGLIAAGVMIPPVGLGIAGLTGMMYLKDKLTGKNVRLTQEIGDIVRGANFITGKVGEKLLAPTLEKADNGIKTVGNLAQEKIEDIFDGRS